MTAAGPFLIAMVEGCCGVVVTPFDRFINCPYDCIDGSCDEGIVSIFSQPGKQNNWDGGFQVVK